ncbi:hypothetical protein [Weissella sp. MSCH1]|uniref:hypothetical protein n=1 Tax=Weissella sp. MSCH1 TaxID=3383343 RepID=UPI003896D085
MGDLLKFIHDFNWAITTVGATITTVGGLPLVRMINQAISHRRQLEKEVDDRVEQRLTVLEANSDNLAKAQIATLHDRVYAEGERLIAQDWVTLDQLNNFQYLFDAYKALGGNGTGEIIYQHVSELDVVDGITAYTKEAEKKHKENKHE